MSCIYFHSPSGDMTISGSERAMMAVLTQDIARGLVCTTFCTDLAALLPKGAYPLNELVNVNGSGPRFKFSLESWVGGGWGPHHWEVDGEKYDAWLLGINTCMKVGNDTIKLCARLHAQCEIHAYVEGQNRAWLAAIMEKGVKQGILRDWPSREDKSVGQWTALIAWLRTSDIEPVVTSYSVCDQFPNRHTAEYHDPNDEDGDSWYNLPSEEQWSMAMAKLRGNKGQLEIKPDEWDDYTFGHAKDSFWLWEKARELARQKREQEQLVKETR